MGNASRLKLFSDLYQLLIQPPPKKVKYLSKRLGIGERRVYRLLEELGDIGLQVTKYGTTYRIDQPAGGLLVQTITSQEASLLYELVRQLPDTDLFGSAHRDALLEKLAPIASGAAALGLLADRARYVYNTRRLQAAIDNCLRVELLNYQSASSGITRDRTLEPLELLSDLGLLIGYETDARQVKGFKLARIGDVRITGTHFTRHEQHTYQPPDAFGFLRGEHVWQAELLLQQRAWLQFEQQFPVAARLAEPHENSWQLVLQVYDIRPLASFVFTYLDDLKVEGDADFLKALDRFWQDKSLQLQSWSQAFQRKNQ